ncbi:DoxX family protein [Virgibacillus sp. LDC-1]|uniref:DoxX family protein n=1 Tax=Virgibacillus sp. LDC-1 TaxID=3039856 RepID=UPI0024DE255E|nr:DoxX family protein [Virgibacillus sp. LDC-1]
MNIHISMYRWIGYAVGYVFITSGVMKLLAADFKGIFSSLAIPFPVESLFILALIEIACGALIVSNLYVKQASIPLIFVILGALYITKLPLLLEKGIVSFAFEARLDIVMLMLLLVLWRNSPGRI